MKKKRDITVIFIVTYFGGISILAKLFSFSVLTNYVLCFIGAVISSILIYLKKEKT